MIFGFFWGVLGFFCPSSVLNCDVSQEFSIWCITSAKHVPIDVFLECETEVSNSVSSQLCVELRFPFHSEFSK